jgi:hypothetical protein
MVRDDAIHSSRRGPVPMPRTARDVVADHTVDGVVFQQISDQSFYQDQWLPIVAPLWPCLARAPGAPSEAEAEQLLT